VDLPPIDPSVVRDEADAEALDQMDRVGEQNFEACANGCRYRV